MNLLIQPFREFPRWLRKFGPGLTLVAGATALALWVSEVTILSAGAIALAIFLLDGPVDPVELALVRRANLANLLSLRVARGLQARLRDDGCARGDADGDSD